MTTHRTAWAVAASLLAHLAVLGWMQGFGGLATGPTAQGHAPQPRTLHVLLLPPASPEQPEPTARPVALSARPKGTSTSATRSAALRPTTARPVVAPAMAQLETQGQATRLSTTETSASPPSTVTPEAPAQPLDLNLPQRRAAHGVRSTAGALPGWGGNGPVTPEPSAAQTAAAAARLTTRGEANPGPISVREQRSTTQTQAEVRTPFGRYCMRKRASSRLTELHDSPFGQGMQSTNCPDG